MGPEVRERVWRIIREVGYQPHASARLPNADCFQDSNNGTVDHSSNQSAEVWTGVTYALASAMLARGLEEEAWRTAWGIYHITYEEKGYWFRTPEAWDRQGNFRASMYLRPGAIWAIE